MLSSCLTRSVGIAAIFSLFPSAFSAPSDGIPHTGVVRKYEFNVARAVLSPDGYEKSMILVNGQFPGPQIDADWGDEIQVTVHNNIAGPPEGTAIHWHGFGQRGTPWYDGTAGVTQCPITPGDKLVYKFRADFYGTTWWHGHYSAQYADGLYGPIVVRGPKHANYDIDIGPIMLADYYHSNYTGLVQGAGSTTGNFSILAPPSDNNMINGRNSFNCSTINTNEHKCTSNAPLSEFKFKAGKVHLLRLINSGPAAMQRFSIDGHNMTVISNDFTPIQPYDTNIVNLAIGQRSEVLVKGSLNPLPLYWMRTAMAANCTASKNFNAKAIVRYGNTQPSATPNTTGYDTKPLEINCANDDLTRTKPLISQAANLYPDVTQIIELNYTTNSSGNHIWVWNNQTFRPDYSNPLLFLAQNKSYTPTPEAQQNLFDFGDRKVIRIVINNKYQAAHPIHIHGGDMTILAEGDGPWDGTTITNPSNPQRRDVQMLRRYGHLVIQIERPNPGVWAFHCHIAWHASTGMLINLLEGKKKMQKLSIPDDVKQGCKKWREWSSVHGEGLE